MQEPFMYDGNFSRLEFLTEKFLKNCCFSYFSSVNLANQEDFFTKARSYRVCSKYGIENEHFMDVDH